MHGDASAMIPNIAYDLFKGLDVDSAGRVSEMCVTLEGTLSPKATDIIRCYPEDDWHRTDLDERRLRPVPTCHKISRRHFQGSE